MALALLFSSRLAAEESRGVVAGSTNDAASIPLETQATTSVGGGTFDLGEFLGAEAYYGNPGNPITGQNSVAYNLEAGHIWNGHEALTHVSTFLNSPETWGGGEVAPLYDRHATWAAMLIGGR